MLKRDLKNDVILFIAINFKCRGRFDSIAILLGFKSFNNYTTVKSVYHDAVYKDIMDKMIPRMYLVGFIYQINIFYVLYIYLTIIRI